LEPSNWIRVHPSHCHDRLLKCSHTLYCHHIKISKYTTFKPITYIVFLCINLPMILTLYYITCSCACKQRAIYDELWIINLVVISPCSMVTRFLSQLTVLNYLSIACSILHIVITLLHIVITFLSIITTFLHVLIGFYIYQLILLLHGSVLLPFLGYFKCFSLATKGEMDASRETALC